MLRGKVAVVTGASKGIGLAVTKALVAEGARVVAGARRIDGELAGVGVPPGRSRLSPWTSDSRRTADPGVPGRRSRSRLDILVNNVGAVSPRLDLAS